MNNILKILVILLIITILCVGILLYMFVKNLKGIDNFNDISQNYCE